MRSLVVRGRDGLLRQGHDTVRCELNVVHDLPLRDGPPLLMLFGGIVSRVIRYADFRMCSAALCNGVFR